MQFHPRYGRIPLRRAGGFSMIEMMVGLLVGLIVALAVIQSLSLFDSQKNTSTSISQAQENGLISLAMLEQDIHNAGSGFADKAPYACTNYYTWYDDGTVTGAITKPDGTPFDILPVRITDPGTAQSDTITVQYGSNFLGTLPATLQATATSAEAPYVSSRVFGYSAGDMLLSVIGTDCTLSRVTATDPNLLTISHDPAAAGANYNPSPAPISWILNSGGTKLFDLGQFVTNQYTVTGGNLVVNHQVLGPLPRTRTSDTLASNIVDLQAQYGVTVANPATVQQATTVAQWVNATTPPWNAPSSADITRIIAVRVAVVARSEKMEAAAVTSQCTTASGVVNNGPCAWYADSAASPSPVIDLSADPNWAQYRYRVYQNIIPLRNVIWTFSQ
jgi:type IV pilus assembly protein PilW